MTDNKEEIIIRNSQISYDDFSQFKEINCEEDLTPIQERLYFLMLHGNIIRGESEALYGWCGRIGLSNSTIFGIFKKNNKNMHLSVAKKIAQATGANALWIKDGIGEAFPEIENPQGTDLSLEELANKHNIKVEIAKNTAVSETSLTEGLKLSTNLNLEKLKETLETTEEILESQHRTMRPEARGEFTVMLYSMIIDPTAQPLNNKLLQDCVCAVELTLEQTRREMSPDKKAMLITAIYTMYIESIVNIEELLTTADILLRRTA